MAIANPLTSQYALIKFGKDGFQEINISIIGLLLYAILGMYLVMSANDLFQDRIVRY